MTSDILNYNPAMEYRRFGKTNEIVSAITLGGMRFIHGWDNPRNEIPLDTQEHCNSLVQSALDAGINLIETAFGYTKSETAFGNTLNEELKIPRDSYYLMTKGVAETATEMRSLVERQLKDLQTDYFDVYGFHGINTMEICDNACAAGGPIEELLKLKEEGVIKHVGFSTHAPLDVIIKAIETDMFDFVNLHYYYTFQRNQGAIDLAESKDMGVFIISPNDKGGQLYKAPQKFKDAIPHATPIQWNARFCLSNPAVHTLTFGLTADAHFDEMKGLFPTNIPFSALDHKSKLVLDDMTYDDPYAAFEGYGLLKDESGIDIPSLLRLRKMWKCYDMLDFGIYRYKELRTLNHWFPGLMATSENIDKIDLSKVPDNIPLKEMLIELHEAIFTPETPKLDLNTLKIDKEAN